MIDKSGGSRREEVREASSSGGEEDWISLEDCRSPAALRFRQVKFIRRDA